MADHRKPAFLISVKYPTEQTNTVSLFPAADFPGGENAEDRYRVRIGRSWHMPGGQKYAFLTVDEAWNLLLGRTSAPAAPPEPKLPKGSPVRVPSSGPLGKAFCTRTMCKPFQGVDGRWRLFCILFDDPILVDDLQGVNGKGILSDCRDAGSYE